MTRLRSAFAHVAVASALVATPGGAAAAPRGPAPVSEIVVDAASGRTVYEAQARRRRPPASLAKVMTLLLVFDALRSGRLDTGDTIVMTAAGARQAPSRLGLARGRTIGLASAMRTVAVISANDVAVALADRIGGSEAKFVARMNARAAEIGMTDTRFGNATGLAPGAGYTTAADMAVLARYVIQRYPERYRLFGTRSIRWKGWTRPSHNQLLGKVKGVDGMKTGYTVEAGFNLIASAKRKTRRTIVVVMGARTASARDLLVANLLESGLTVPATLRPTPEPKPTVARRGVKREPDRPAPRHTGKPGKDR